MHQFGGEADQLLAEAAAHHQAAGEDEERQGEHREGEGLVDHLLGDQHHREFAGREDGEAGGDDEDVSDRDGEEQEDEEGNDEGGDHTTLSSAAPCGLASGPSRNTRMDRDRAPSAVSSEPLARA